MAADVPRVPKPKDVSGDRDSTALLPALQGAGAADRGRSMTARPRQASAMMGTGAAVSVTKGAENGAGLDRTPHFSWEDWFRHASAHQRAEALGLAKQQGFLYPHQLPHLSNGTQSALPTPESKLVSDR